MAEKIVNEFTVNKPIDEAWPIICDVERIAPCLPGAQLEEIEGEIYRGRVKVKLGAVTAQFKGEANFVERDDVAHTAKLHGKGRDTGGRGNAEADIYAVAEALSPTSTKCTVTADLYITGKVAQFGRGIMGDVSKKLIDQFSTNLNTMLDESGDEPAAEPAAASSDTASTDTASTDAGSSDSDTTDSDATETVASDAGSSDGGASPAAGASTAAGSAAAATATTTATDEKPTIRKIDGPAAEPVDLADMAGAALLKRIAPVVAAVLLLVLLLRRKS